MYRRDRRDAGFSMLEAIVVVGLIAVSSVGIIQMKTSLAALDADKASNLVRSQLTYARQVAVNQRRNVEVEFVDDSQIILTRLNADASETVLTDVTLPAGYVFGLPSGVSADTPDAYGNETAVYFNEEAGGTFLSDGTFVDSSTSVLLNGSVFTIGSGNGSARSVTLAGSTGRVKQYWLSGPAWVTR